MKNSEREVNIKPRILNKAFIKEEGEEDTKNKNSSNSQSHTYSAGNNILNSSCEKNEDKINKINEKINNMIKSHDNIS